MTLRPVKGQGRGLIAERDISAGELLLRVPQRLLLTRARALEELPEAYAAVLGSLPEYSVLAAFLALAATPGMVPETYFAPYLRALSTASGCVLEWPSLGVRELLRGSPTLPRALERRAQADFMREELQGALQGAGLPVPPDGAVTWALSMLLSRAVRLESLEVCGWAHARHDSPARAASLSRPPCSCITISITPAPRHAIFLP